jgi:hypothetical protein
MFARIRTDLVQHRGNQCGQSNLGLDPRHWDPQTAAAAAVSTEKKISDVVYIYETRLRERHCAMRPATGSRLAD